MPETCAECGVWVNRYEPVCTNCGTINPSFADDVATTLPATQSSSRVGALRESETVELPVKSGAQLRFNLFGIPVSVHWTFLIMAVLGMNIYSGIEIVVWTVAVFLAVLLHESGHAFTARRFGARPVAIQLFAFGGATTWPRDTAMTPGQRFIATAAGSGVGLLAGGGVIVAVATTGFLPFDSLLGVAADSFVWASLVWGGLNWIPVLPLDGGQMLRAFFDALAPKAAYNLTRATTVVVGGLMIWGLISIRDWYLAAFAGIIVLGGLRTPDVGSVDVGSGILQEDDGRRIRSAIWMGIALLAALGVVYLAVTGLVATSADL